MNRIAVPVGDEGELMMNSEPRRDLFEKDEYISDDDDECSSEDGDAHLKQLRPMQTSLRRNDSFDNFMTRSERNALLGKDQPPPPSEAKKRKIQFRDVLEEIREVGPIDEEDRSSYWMTGSDFDRIETELRVSTIRWENHVAGKIAFDEANNSMRGLEHLERKVQSCKNLAQFKHHRSVLEEINRQKLKYGKVTDWGKIRMVSEQHSEGSMKHAAEMGKRDEDACRRAWGEIRDNVVAAICPPVQKKNHKSIFFWRKK